MKTSLGLLIGLSLAMAGCGFLVGAGVGGAGGVAGYKFITGELVKVYPIEYETMVTATETALRDLEIRAVDTRKDALGGTVSGARADGTSVKVSLEPTPAHKTTVRIRVGTLGDRDSSEKIMAKIDEIVLRR